MHLRLRELALEENPVSVRGQLDLQDTVSGRNDLRLKGTVEVDAVARSASETAVVSGTLTANLAITCSRCLQQTERTMSFPFTEMFTMRPDIAEDDEDIHLVADEKVDLKPYLREAFAVQLPIAAICQDECKGLCPVCGSNRNIEACGCVQERIDPRLAGLKDFFKNVKD
jgi:uncharacterized protein